MTRRLFPALTLLFLTGCAATNTASSASSAAPTLQAQCEDTGGEWRQGMCEKRQGGGGY